MKDPLSGRQNWIPGYFRKVFSDYKRNFCSHGRGDNTMTLTDTAAALERLKETVDLFCKIVDKFIAQGEKQRADIQKR